MGFNTVAVLYNDTVDVGARDPQIGERIQSAVLAWSVRDSCPGRTSIFARAAMGNGISSASYGLIVSQAHADYSQVVVVGQNRGRPIVECDDLDHYALGQIADALRRHGWTVKPPAKKRQPRPTGRNG